jgi:hypothetical protein
MVGEVNLSALVRAAGCSSIEIVVPLESAKMSTRRLVGKTFTNAEFIMAAEMIRESGALFSTSVLLKPPGLTEAAAIDDACESLAWAALLQPARTVLEPMFIYEGTRLQQLYLDGKYVPPWLWSVLDVREAVQMPHVEVGGELHYPAPYATPRSCVKCNGVVWHALRRPNPTEARRAIRTTCDCRERWQRETGCTGKFGRQS